MSDTKKYTLLFVDDEKRILTALRSTFRRKYDVYTANGATEALSILENTKIDVIVSDQRMPGMLGNELLAQVHKHHPNTMRLLLTGFMDKEAIINTINEGEIYRFINKPWKSEEIQKIIAEAALASKYSLDSNVAESNTSIPTQETAATEEHKNQAVLMLGDNQLVRNQVRRLCRQRQLPVYGTSTIAQAIGVIAANDKIGVAIIELPKSADEAIHAVSLLKQNRPALTTVILTDETDAEIAVDLINTGQVFRYLAKPLEDKKFKTIIDAAFCRHNVLKNNSQIRRRYAVAKPTTTIASGLKKLFSSFGFF
ncbi:MAG: response regulator [Pseudomonadota bacterium]